MTKTTKKAWGFTTDEYLTLSRPDFWTTVDLTAAPVDGDILLRSGHVALLTADNHVVQAEQHDTGVHASETYDAGNWKMRLHPVDGVIA